KKLIIIIRNDGLRKGAGNTAKEAFSGFGSAGGHKTMARAELDLNQVRKQVKSISKKNLGDWIISIIEKTAGKKIE
ncbi:MAG: phosphoesterase, partial [Desulfobacula sp.]|nr:phosphoesterase [Desulfobacula sp.]